jgi:DDE_Tnp_1-associated
VSSSWLAGCIRRHLPAGTARDPVSLRESLEGLLTDPRKPRGKRHPLPSLVSVMVAGVASGHGGALAVAQAAVGWDQDVLAGHGCRISPRTGLRVPPSASMLDRLPRLLDADEFEAALSACLAQAALDPAIPAAYAAHRQDEQRR